MKNDANYHCLYKTDCLEVGHIYEEAYLTNNSTNNHIHIGSFYGDPTCAFINEDNSWGVVGGEFLILFKDYELIKIDEIELVFDLKLIDKNTIQILTDPWSEHPFIWQLNVESLVCIKVQSFEKYKDKEHTENIEW